MPVKWPDIKVAEANAYRVVRVQPPKSFTFSTFVGKPERNYWFYIWLPNKYLAKPCLISSVALFEVQNMAYKNVALNTPMMFILNQYSNPNETPHDSP